ncbi:MAG: hypothetical protein GTO24_17130 [candidate division Zixibacteria bacterium]|nr:hypothetical protein [candidate division Zixibacteria bacterium]
MKGCEYNTCSPFLLPDEYIGTGKTLDAGSFFSGLIDDVRIYNQTLSIERIEALAQ